MHTQSSGGEASDLGAWNAQVVDRFLSGTPDMMFFADLNVRDFANILQAELGSFQVFETLNP